MFLNYYLCKTAIWVGFKINLAFKQNSTLFLIIVITKRECTTFSVNFILFNVKKKKITSVLQLTQNTPIFTSFYLYNITYILFGQNNQHQKYYFPLVSLLIETKKILIHQCLKT